MEQKLEFRKTYLGTVRKKVLLISLQNSLPERQALLHLEERDIRRWYSGSPWAVGSITVKSVGMRFALVTLIGSTLAHR